MAKAKILLVQNRQTHANGTDRILERAGYAVVRAAAGTSARSVAARETVDLIVIDAALPDVEGSELCELFRRHHATSAMPIILLTVRGYTPLSPKASLYAPDDYVAKPFTAAELDARIIAALNMKQLKRELDRKNVLLQETRARAESASIIDPATGLFNRPQFEALFSKEFKRAVRYKQPVSCMRIELDQREDGRKIDEDTAKAIIALVQSTIREVDTAAWWTGDGFIVLIPNTPRENALQAAARILMAVAEHPFTWSDSTTIAMNIGVAGLPDEKLDTEVKLVEAAEAALHNARHFQRLPPVTIPRKTTRSVPSRPAKKGS